MKILVISQYFYPEQFRINDICQTFKEKGHEVTVLTGLPNYPSGVIPSEYRYWRKRNEIINGVKILRVPLVARRKGLLWLSLNYLSFVISATFRAFWLSHKFDIVFTYQLSPVTSAIPAVIYKRIARKKMLLYCMDLWPDSVTATTNISKSSIIYRLLLSVSRWIYRNSDQIAISSKAFQSYLETEIGYQGPITCLPQYAESLFEQVISDKKCLDEDDINLVFAGNIGEMQSIETIIQAANLLCQRQEIRWHIIGDGSVKSQCEKLAENLGLLNRTVFFHGQKPLDQMPLFYASAAAMLVTLKDDQSVGLTLPAKVQSYLAFGKPIIAAANGEVRKVVQESASGLCCDAEDYQALAQRVEEFCNSKEKWPIYELRAREFYDKHYSKDKYINSILEIFKELSIHV